MKYRTLGRTEIEVSEIGFGIGGRHWLPADEHSSREALAKSISLGLNFIDTALATGEGQSEKMLAPFLNGHGGKNRPRVATKIPPKNYAWPPQPGTRLDRVFPNDWIIGCTDRSLKSLGVETIDLQQFHVWSPEWLGHQGWRESVIKLKRDGKIRAFGVSVNDHQPESVRELVRSGLIDSIQVIFNIFDQSPTDGLLDLCAECGVGVVARCPFDEGSLAGAIHPETVFPSGDFRQNYFRGDRRRQVWERVDELQQVVAPYGISVAEAALRFCLSYPAVSCVVPGMRQVSYAERNCAASDHGPLPPELLESLRTHRWQRNFYGP
jgi:aryl-alcohol dehydrogenase-like predicted oxidoreductase